MIVITGAAGFIGYNLLLSLKDKYNIVAIDNNIIRLVERKHQNIKYLSVEDSYIWLQFNAPQIKYVIHLGARTDTTEKNTKIFKKLNLDYSKFIWSFCSEEKIPLIYASSAAVYGDGFYGFNDDEPIFNWRYYPLNPYGESKYFFDKWVIYDQIGENDDEIKSPPFWAGLRFFNVYGYHEEHKNHMASVVWHFYNQMKKTGKAYLFKSYRVDYPHGCQMRDFIFVDDIVDVIKWFMDGDYKSGIYNVGTGKPRTFNDVAIAISNSLGISLKLSYIDMPDNIRQSYQYFTKANIKKLRSAGYKKEFTSLENGVDKYIKFLENENR